MKKIFLIIAFVFAACFSAVAQDKTSLDAAAQQLYINTVAGNYEAVANSTYPKIFEIIPKDKMMEALKSMLKGDGYSMLMLKTDPKFEYGPIKKIDEGTYCMIKHDLLMKMTFATPLGAEEGKTMTQNFKNAMQTEDVTFDAASNSFTMKKRVDVIAVADKSTGNKWKFLNKSGNKLMAKVFDEKVIKQLGL